MVDDTGGAEQEIQEEDSILTRSAGPFMSTTPRNIVLLSDGTGNSSAKLMKTNVWRMYEAIELTTGDQLGPASLAAVTHDAALFDGRG